MLCICPCPERVPHVLVCMPCVHQYMDRSMQIQRCSLLHLLVQHIYTTTFKKRLLMHEYIGLVMFFNNNSFHATPMRTTYLSVHESLVNEELKKWKVVKCMVSAGCCASIIQHVLGDGLNLCLYELCHLLVFAFASHYIGIAWKRKPASYNASIGKGHETSAWYMSLTHRLTSLL